MALPPDDPDQSEPTQPDEPTEPGELPAPPAAQPTDRWSVDPGAIIPVGPAAGLDGAGGVGPRRRGRRALAIGLGAVLALAVTGAAVAFFVLRGSTADLLGRVPADVDAVAVGYLDPSAAQKMNVARLTDAFPSLGGADGAAERLKEWGDEALEGTGLHFDDIRSWVGVEAAVAVDVVDGTPQTAILVHVADRENAERMIAKLRAPGAPWENATWTEREYQGVSLSISGDVEFGAPSYAFDDDVLILASHEDLLERLIDTHRGESESIATAASFQEMEAELPDGRLMVAFADTASLFEELGSAFPAEAAASLGGLGDLPAIEGIGMSVSAEPRGVAVDVVALYDSAELTGALREQVMAPDHENTLIQSVPAEAWGVFAAQHLEFGIQEAIDELESQDPNVSSELSALGLTGQDGLLEFVSGDLAIGVAPDQTTTVGGALLLGVTEGPDTEAAVERVATSALDLIAHEIPTSVVPEWQTITHADGTEISYIPDAFIAYALRGDMLVIGSSVEQVEAVLDAGTDGSLADDASFTRGIEGVPATDALFYVDVGRVVESIRQALPPDERASFDQDIRPDLRPVLSAAFGAEADETRQRMRLFVAVDVGTDAA